MRPYTPGQDGNPEATLNTEALCDELNVSFGIPKVTEAEAVQTGKPLTQPSDSSSCTPAGTRARKLGHSAAKALLWHKTMMPTSWQLSWQQALS